MLWYEKDTLRQCNSIRVACGNEPLTEIPKGRKQVHDGCPIALALSNGVTASVTDTVELNFPYGAEDAELQRIARRLRQLGFRNVRVNIHSQGWHAPRIEFNCTQAMERFITEFDEGKLEQYIKGA